jgi:Fe-S-cluster containining protein
MGRIKSDTYDRRFTDDYFLDYLRVKKIESEVLETINCRNDKWKNILSKNGLLLLAEAFKNLNVNGLTVLHKIKDCQNCNLILEIFSSSLFIGENDNIDCKDITFEYGECSFLDLSNTEISNFKMNYCDIYELNLTNSKLSNCFIENTSFGKIFGLSSKTGLPKYFDKSCSYSEFQQISSISKIKSVTLKPSQQYLVLIIQKVFNQKGSGKKEEVLTRGFQGIYNKKMAKDILNLLIKNDILFTHPGDEGLIYKGNRKQQPRMEKILEELTLSKDELWEKVSKMK